MSYIEPWLRGIEPDIDPVVGHLLRSAEQIDEEIAGAIRDLRNDQLWATPNGMTSVGFHAKHLAGSTTRLCTYLEGKQLSERALAWISTEATGSESASDLLSMINTALRRYASLVRALKPEDYGSIRYVGRKRIEVTAIGLAIHIAEHGQRHLGQAIGAGKIVRALVR